MEFIDVLQRLSKCPKLYLIDFSPKTPRYSAQCLKTSSTYRMSVCRAAAKELYECKDEVLNAIQSLNLSHLAELYDARKVSEADSARKASQLRSQQEAAKADAARKLSLEFQRQADAAVAHESAHHSSGWVEVTSSEYLRSPIRFVNHIEASKV